MALAASEVSSRADAILMAEVSSSRPGPGVRDAERAGACAVALQQYLDTSPDIFKVRSGQYRGMKVPENLRCGVFQSNVAEQSGLIHSREVTVRALEFGKLIARKGWQPERFDPNKDYPDGTYLVGNGARDGTNSRHVAVVCEGKIVHTSNGKVVSEPIANKFYPGAYDSITAYTPPKKHR